MILLDIIFIFILIFLGGAMTYLIVPQAGKLEMVSLGLPLGLGVNTTLLFWLSWSGVSLSKGVFWIVPIGLLAAALVYLRVSTDNPGLNGGQEWIKQIADVSFFQVILVVGVVAFVVVAAWRALLTSYGSWDAAAIWAAKGYGISLEKSIFAAEVWGSHGLAYPLNMPLAIAIFQTLSGDVLPSSKLLFPLFLGSAGLGLATHAFMRGAHRWLAVAGAFLLLSTPLFFLHGSIGYVNLPFSVYLILGLIWGFEAMDNGRKGSFLMSGLLLALSTWSRPEGIGYLLTIIPAMIVLHRLLGENEIKWFAWLTPVIIIYGPWFLLSRTHMASGSIGGYLNVFLDSLGRGQYNLFELYLIPRLFLDRALDPRQWGVLFPVAGFVLLLSIWRYHPRRFPGHFVEVALAPIVALIPVGLFYIQSFTLGSQYITILNRSFDRAFFPATMFLVYLVMRAFPRAREEKFHR